MNTGKATPGAILYEGEEVILGGQKYILPPLSFRQLRSLESTLDKMIRGKDSNFLSRVIKRIFKRRSVLSDQIDRSGAVIKIVHAALTRNYPKLKLKEVEEMIDNKSIETLVKAVMGITGIELGERKAGKD